VLLAKPQGKLAQRLLEGEVEDLSDCLFLHGRLSLLGGRDKGGVVDGVLEVDLELLVVGVVHF
jgi:hypothetical protein